MAIRVPCTGAAPGCNWFSGITAATEPLTTTSSPSDTRGSTCGPAPNFIRSSGFGATASSSAGCLNTGVFVSGRTRSGNTIRPL